MKKYTQFLVIIVLISMIMGCVSQETKDTFSKHATAFSSGAGALAGGALGYVAGGKKGAVFGALIGGVLGAALGYEFTRQDEENIETVLEKPNSTDQKYSWCSNSRSIATGDLESCGSESRKIMMTPGKVQFQSLPNSEGQQKCRDIEIEVMDSNDELKSTTQTLCKDNNGKWKPKK